MGDLAVMGKGFFLDDNFSVFLYLVGTVNG